MDNQVLCQLSVKPKANVNCQLNFRLFVSCQLKFCPFVSCQLTPSRPSSKLTEKAVVIHLQTHMLTNSLFPEMQSAYREHHSTGTALLKVKSDILMNMDMGHVTLLVVWTSAPPLILWTMTFLFIDLSHCAAYVLRSALQWFRSYLRGRSQQVTINGVLFKKFGLECEVPHCPLLFTIYASKLFSVIKSHLSSALSYADDTPLYLL